MVWPDSALNDNYSQTWEITNTYYYYHTRRALTRLAAGAPDRARNTTESACEAWNLGNNEMINHYYHTIKIPI